MVSRMVYFLWRRVKCTKDVDQAAKDVVIALECMIAHFVRKYIVL